MSAIGAPIFTIGHSTHPLPEFEALLARHDVALVADVRLHPGSRRMPHFNRESLAEALPYVHLPELGGRRRPAPESPNAGWENAAFRGYADHMASEEFRSGLARLEAVAGERRTAVMCAEGLWWRCHRRLVSDALVARGWEVLHILPDGSLSPHELTYPPAQGNLL